jgi:carbon-monoxide dehydrogenase medium subunit
MKAANFEYLKPATLDEALAALARRGDSAQVIAGGQSLMAMLNLRLAAPGCLVDISGLPGLRDIRREGDVLRIGALVTHRAIEDSAEVAASVPLLAQAVPHVAHLAIRNAGTIGGSLALADPAAEYPAVALALEATIVVQGAGGSRRIPASDYFQGFYRTAREPNELVVGVEFPVQRPGERAHFDELARRRGDYAMVGLAAQLRFDGTTVASVRLAYLAVGDRPMLASHAMAALQGKPLDAPSIRAAQDALSKDLDPGGDLQADPTTKMHLARVLLGRAAEQLRRTA